LRDKETFEFYRWDCLEKIHNDTDRETLREYAKQVNDNARDMLNKIYDVIEKSKSELNNEKKEKL